nr:MAG TPA: hypothetical protein [Caudoviricetes sp.]
MSRNNHTLPIRENFYRKTSIQRSACLVLFHAVPVLTFRKKEKQKKHYSFL